MARVVKSEAWDHTSAMWTLTANINRAEGQEPFHPADIHPFRERKDYPEDDDAKREKHQSKVALMPTQMQKRTLQGIERLNRENANRNRSRQSVHPSTSG